MNGFCGFGCTHLADVNLAWYVHQPWRILLQASPQDAAKPREAHLPRTLAATQSANTSARFIDSARCSKTLFFELLVSKRPKPV